MSAFDDINDLAADFNEALMGESFSYTSPAGVTVSGLTGVFNQVAVDYAFEDYAQRAQTEVVLVASKTQWGATVPANRGTITYGAIGYSIEKVDGANTGGEPCFTLQLKRLT
jgi:hypothetical protein